MKTGKNTFIFISMFLGIAALTATPSLAAKKKTLRVGLAFRTTDKFNSTISNMMAGIETAQSVFEKAHPNVKINTTSYPHALELETVLKAAQSAVKDQMPAVIGAEGSDEAFVLGDTLEENKTVFITPTSSNPRVTENKSYVFRACFTDTYVADRMAEFAINDLKPKVLGVFRNVSSAYTDYLSSRFRSSYVEISKSKKLIQSSEVYEQKVLEDTLDYSTQIQYFMDHKVTHLAMFAHQSELFRFTVQAANRGFFPVYIGSDGWGSDGQVYSSLVKEATNGDKFVGYRNSYWKEDSNSKMAQLFRAEFQKKFNRDPNAWAAIAFDTAWVLFTAMERAKNPNDSSEIQKEMKKIRNMQLVTAEQFTIGKDNSPIKDLYIYKVSKSGIQYEATLK